MGAHAAFFSSVNRVRAPFSVIFPAARARIFCGPGPRSVTGASWLEVRLCLIVEIAD